MAARRRPLAERRWRRLMRWLGGPDSWRRIIVTGATAGIAIAVVAALVVALVGGDGGSLNTVKPGVGDPLDREPDTVEPPPVEVPTEPPIEEPPTEVATEAPIAELPTEVPAEPTPTAPEKPPPQPTLAEGA